MKICLIASSGGHYEQIMRLSPLFEDNSGFIVTEKTLINNKADYYIPQVNRKNINIFIKMFSITFKSLKIILKEKPNVVISTGALCCIPFCIIAKIYGSKIIFIESFAKVDTPTLTGRFMYKISDLFIIQWEGLKKYYPNAIYGGAIY